jgi:hypothetical protein
MSSCVSSEGRHVQQEIDLLETLREAYSLAKKTTGLREVTG